MTRAFLLSSLLLAGCFGQPGATGADETSTGTYTPDAALATGGEAVVANTGDSGLNLRDAAASSATVILVMPEGSHVRIEGSASNGYYPVSYQTTKGWAFGAYLRGVAMAPTNNDPKPDPTMASPDSLGGMYPKTSWAAASGANYTDGREGKSIKYVVIHDMEGSYQSAISWFENAAAEASAHYCIRSSDGDITQMVKETNTAWHAGNWTINTESVGIEHEGYAAQPDKYYTDAMYRQSARLTAAICHRYNIPVDRDHIFGHAEVPDPNNPGQFGGAGHHTDPGDGWKWDNYLALVKSYY